MPDLQTRVGLDGCQQCLGVPNLRKLRRRRKPFQRRPERGVGVGVAASRAIELGERQRGAQLEAAGLLLLRDGDGGEEGGFGGGGVGGVLFEEDFAADAMESGVEPMLAGLARERQRFVDLVTRAASTSPASASISASSPRQNGTRTVALLLAQYPASACRNSVEPASRSPSFARRPGRGQRSKGR